MRKASLWLTVLALGSALPMASGMTELETLRQRCADQERLIERLQQELALRSATGEAQPPKAIPVADAPAKAPPPDPATPAPSPSDAVTTYIVRAGDSFDRIGRKFGCSAAALAKANNLELNALIHPGLKLTVPSKTTTPAAPPSSPSPPAAATSGSSTSQPPTTTVKPPSATAPLELVPVEGTEIDPPATDPPAADPPAADPPAADPPAADPPAADPPAAAPPGTDPPGTVSSPSSGKTTHAVKIDVEMTYGEFASKHGTDIGRLNELNGLDLQHSTVLAKGSELYVPGE